MASRRQTIPKPPDGDHENTLRSCPTAPAPVWSSPDKLLRVSPAFFFACNMDPSGTKPFEPTPVIDRCVARHTRDYAELSDTPDQFKAFADAVGQMQSGTELFREIPRRDRSAANIRVPVVQRGWK